MPKPTRIFSGVKPTGELHLGNYLGALKHWVKLQSSLSLKDRLIFCVVDQHALTVPFDPQKLRELTRSIAAWYLAVGIDPQKTLIFVQSDNPDHSYLSWILNNYTSVGELNRMTQFKEKSAHEGFVSVGLYSYPVLMAADILLYDTNLVPVGEDQKQHIELTRDIARRFNARHNKLVFTLPNYMPPPAGKRIMSLQNPLSKMSKSEADPKGTINLSDDADTIREKILGAVTDSGDEVCLRVDKPAVSNLLTIFMALSGCSEAELSAKYSGRGYQKFKRDLAELVISELIPMQKKYARIRSSGELEEVLRQGALQACELSQRKVGQVKEVIGLGSGTARLF